jgi:hypothetical protein
MQSPEEAKDRAADQPTRQQLDELDALMQRMLALPVSGAEEEPAVPVATPAATSPPYPFRFEEEEAEVVQPVLESVPPEAKKERVLSGLGMEKAAATAPVFEDFRFDQPVRPLATTTPRPKPPVRETHDVVEKEAPVPAPAPVAAPTVVVASWWLRPLLRCNQVYDRCSQLLGPTGRWLRGEHARALLGWVGIVLLAAAVTWVTVEGIGWIW